MKVIMLEKFKKLGEVGNVVEVKNGYARNFLIPSKKAIQATKSNIADFESKKAELIKISEEKESEAIKLSKKIDRKIVLTVKQAGDDGRLYGSVTNTEIATAIKEKTSVEIDRKQIIINSAIKFLGFYKIEVDLGEGVEASVIVNVARSEAEGSELEAKFEKGKIDLGPLNLEEASKHEEAPELSNIIGKKDSEAAAQSGDEDPSPANDVESEEK